MSSARRISERDDFKAELLGRRLNLGDLKLGDGCSDMMQDRQMADIWNNLAQQFESLASEIRL